MGSFSREALQLDHDNDGQVIVIIDQSTITNFHRHELIMLSLDVGKPAIPLCWRVSAIRQNEPIVSVNQLKVPLKTQTPIPGDLIDLNY